MLQSLPCCRGILESFFHSRLLYALIVQEETAEKYNKELIRAIHLYFHKIEAQKYHQLHYFLGSENLTKQIVFKSDSIVIQQNKNDSHLA